MNDDNEEITRILNDIIQLITKEKYFIKVLLFHYFI